jgi:four helix bundle protein
MGKGRLKPDFLDRTEVFSDHCVAAAEQLLAQGWFLRLVDQLAASGSSVGANIAEADQAMSARDFRKCLSIVAKEFAETRFWLRLVIRRGWIAESKLRPLLTELEELRLIVGSILSRTAKPRNLDPSTPL